LKHINDRFAVGARSTVAGDCDKLEQRGLGCELVTVMTTSAKLPIGFSSFLLKIAITVVKTTMHRI
jgi:hypothetical protein